MSRAPCDGAIVHARELVVGKAPAAPWLGPGAVLETYADGAVAWLDGEVVEAGPTDDVLAEWDPRQVDDAAGCTVTAGLVDAHTHLVWGGDRADEFAARLAGESYEAIAQSGGGILATVRATRACEEEELFARAARTAWRMLAAGVTTIEAKSGYELSKDGELGLLAVAARVRRETPLAVVGTALAAHVLPPEYARNARRYLDEVAWPVAQQAHDQGHAEFVDVFVEEGAFDAAFAKTLARRARGIGMGLRLHVDQLKDGRGAGLAALLGADSADHLDHAREEGIAALSEAGTVAVLTPFAALTLGSPPPPVAALRAHHVPTAIATDFNPGTSTLDALPTALALACRMWKLSPEEALLGATEAPARSLRRAGRIGCLRPGADADLVVWDAPSARTLVYHVGASFARAVYRKGARVLPRA